MFFLSVSIKHHYILNLMFCLNPFANSNARSCIEGSLVNALVNPFEYRNEPKPGHFLFSILMCGTWEGYRISYRQNSGSI